MDPLSVMLRTFLPRSFRPGTSGFNSWRRPCTRNFSFTPNHYFPRVPPPTPSFREAVARASPGPSFSESAKSPSIRNQVIFFVVGSFVVYSVAARQTNIETMEWTKQLSESGLMWKFRPPSSDEIRRARNYELAKDLRAGLSKVQAAIEQWPATLRNAVIWSYVQGFQPILDTSDGKRMCWSIGLTSTAIWIAWQIPRLRPAMMTRFTHTPLSGLSYTILTSTFSHKSAIHLLCNMMALASFGSAASVFMVKEQNTSPTGMTEADVKWHVLAFFISAGLFSGMASHVFKARFLFPRMVTQLRANAATSAHAVTSGSVSTTFRAAASEASTAAERTILPSLGASGAVYAAAALTMFAFPETEVSLIFPPSFPIPIQYGIGSLIALDIIGLLRGWRLFDHAAHLSGAAFGAWYCYYGMPMWDMFRVANLPGVIGKKPGQSDSEQGAT